MSFLAILAPSGMFMLRISSGEYQPAHAISVPSGVIFPEEYSAVKVSINELGKSHTYIF